MITYPFPPSVGLSFGTSLASLTGMTQVTPGKLFLCQLLISRKGVGGGGYVGAGGGGGDLGKGMKAG